jgi:alkanesulfonate monooxygenase SsuD/methylene tetrahydromethanopterin reductase-like flavin-dependent oxidoreductase (luciferase family)
MSPPRRSLEFGIILGDVPVEVDARRHLDDLLRQVEAAQRQGFTYICVGQHFLYPSFRWLQPIPLLARLAAETNDSVRLVTSVMITPFYHPVVLAEELATLDVVCEGRLVVGVGAGYRAAEFDYLGVPYSERFARLEEALALMAKVWEGEEFDFDGTFWKLRGATPHVLPLQRPRPPIWMGATRPAGIRRAARLADGWIIPVEMPFPEVEECRDLFTAERQERGLQPTRLPIRREIVLGADVDEALRTYEARTRDRWLAYVARGHAGMDESGLHDDFRVWALERAVLGPPARCIAALQLLEAGELGPVIVRAGWPGMAGEDVVAYLEAVGREVVSAFRSSPERV